MRLLCAILSLAVTAPSARAEVPAPEYASRRAALRATLSGVLVLFGATEKETAELRDRGFPQEPNFLYLTGWRQPGAVLAIMPEGVAPAEILFIPRRSPDKEKWTGAKSDFSDPALPARTGLAEVAPVETLESRLARLLETRAGLLTLAGTPGAARLQALFPLREIGDIRLEIARLRMVKTAAELDLIKQSIEATTQAHRAAWRRAAPGLFEFQLAAAMAAVWLDLGCERPAYASIVGSGPNATVLHYSDSARRLQAGELVVMDAGAECSGYAADLTRTVPASGKFSARQREIYNIVLGAQRAVIDAVKPGMTLGKNAPNSLHAVALEYLDSHGKDLDGNPLGRYFTHGVGHHVGLEVHDASDPALALKPGMVITVEPGLYIPKEGFGVRIEDMVLVTEKGGLLLSGALPRDADEIEKALAK